MNITPNYDNQLDHLNIENKKESFAHNFELPLELLVKIFDQLGHLELQSTESVSKWWKVAVALTVTQKEEFLDLKNFVRTLVDHLETLEDQIAKPELEILLDKDFNIQRLGQFENLKKNISKQLASILAQLESDTLDKLTQSFAKHPIPSALKDVFLVAKLYQKIALANSKKDAEQEKMVWEILKECRAHNLNALLFETAVHFEELIYIKTWVSVSKNDLNLLRVLISNKPASPFKDQILEYLYPIALQDGEDKHVLFLKEMNNHSKASFHFIIFLRSYIVRDKFTDALENFELIEKKHLNESIFLVLLSKALKDHDYDSFLLITKRLTDTLTNLTSSESYQIFHTMITHLIEKNQLNQALELVHHLPKQHKEEIFLDLIEILAINGQFEKALDLARFAHRKAEAYSRLTFILHNQEKFKQFKEILKSISPKELKNQILFGICIKYLKHLKFGHALDLAQQIKNKDLRDKAFYDIIQLLMEFKEYSKAIEVAGQIKDKGLYTKVIKYMESQGVFLINFLRSFLE